MRRVGRRDSNPPHGDSPREEVRNRAAREIAEKYRLPIIDLYAVTEPIPDQLTDGVHLTETGYKALASEIIEKLKNI